MRIAANVSALTASLLAAPAPAAVGKTGIQFAKDDEATSPSRGTRRPPAR